MRRPPSRCPSKSSRHSNRPPLTKGTPRSMARNPCGSANRARAAVFVEVAVVALVPRAESAAVDRRGSAWQRTDSAARRDSSRSPPVRSAAARRGRSLLESSGVTSSFSLRNQMNSRRVIKRITCRSLQPCPAPSSGKRHCAAAPLEPVVKLRVEAPVQLLDIERPLPFDMQPVEAAHARLPHARQREVGEDLEMRPVRVGKADILGPAWIRSSTSRSASSL